MAYILLFSFFLQNCFNFSNPISLEEDHAQSTQIESIREIDKHGFIEEEDGKKLIAQGGHIVTIHEKDGQLQAIVEESLPEGFNKIYKSLPVYMEAGTNATEIAQLDNKSQEHFVEINLPKDGKLASVTIYRMGLMGVVKMPRARRRYKIIIRSSSLKSKINPSEPMNQLTASSKICRDHRKQVKRKRRK
jgi:hypothetical protein